MMKGFFITLFVLALIIIAGGTGYYISSVKDKLKQAQDEVEKLQKAQKLSQEAEIKAKAARQVENEKAKERERLMQNVLDGNCDWSRIELPDDVTWMLQYGEAGNSGICPPSNAP